MEIVMFSTLAQGRRIILDNENGNSTAANDLLVLSVHWG
jgi:hypothetical protein